MTKYQVKLSHLKFGILFYLLGSAPTVAQIVPDATLPVNSVVIPQGSTNLIEGGTKAGSNLFHSFSQFNIPTGSTARFNNAFDIKNIFSRVTGNTASNLDGILQTHGTANLFLINPNGISFGSNASLNIGGSFVATTANAIGFGNQGIFSATVPNNPQLLTVLPSSFLFNQIATQPISSQANLQVATGQSLLLVGGKVSLDAGQLFAAGGRVELGGIAGEGTVGLNIDGNNFNLNFPTGEIQRADVGLSNAFEVNVRAGGGGSIAINADNFNMAGESRLRAGIASGMGEAQSLAGNVEIHATQAITLDGGSTIENILLEDSVGNAGNINMTTGSLSLTNGAYLSAATFGVGNAGNINMTTGLLSLTNGAYMAAGTSGEGNAGSVNIVAHDAVNLDGYISGIYSAVHTESIGNGGNINMTTGSLSLTNGAIVGVSTFGNGNAGIINIVAHDAVNLDGVSIYGYSSGIYNSVETEGIGNGGKINVTTGSLSLTNGAQIIASNKGHGNAGSVNIVAHDAVNLDGANSYSDRHHSGIYSSVFPQAIGNGGNIDITTGLLSLTNGAQLVANTLGHGNAGSVNIVAHGAVNLDGTSIYGLRSVIVSGVDTQGIGNGGNINITTGSLSLNNGGAMVASTRGRGNAGSFNIVADDAVNLDGAGIFSSVLPQAIGNGGKINITTGSLSLTNGATLNAQSDGTGDAGNITNLTARSLNLDNASITTGSISGNGGNIENLQVNDLRLRNDSQISTTAGTANSGSGNGGNINFNLDTVVLLENSSISANAFEGRGGNIQINTIGMFQSLDSQITASSKFGLNGEVKVHTPGVDPGSGLTQLPSKPVDVKGLVAQSCSTGGGEGSQLAVTGRGGLPANPTEVLVGDTVLVDLATPSTPITKSEKITPQAIRITTKPQLIEATGWMLNNKGVVTLVANAPNVTPQKLWSDQPSCNSHS